jgi:hypothetical protein
MYMILLIDLKEIVLNALIFMKYALKYIFYKSFFII